MIYFYVYAYIKLFNILGKKSLEYNKQCRGILWKSESEI